MSRKGMNMKVFVFEYATGGGCANAALPAFLADGELMWRALLDDLTAIPGVEVITLRDDRLALPTIPGADIVATRAATYTDDFRHCLDAADAVWMVAPESGGILEKLSRETLLAGKRLLSSRPEGIRIGASKMATAHRLALCGVATIPAYASPYLMIEDGPIVMKPDDGAGCQDTRLFANLEEAEAWTLTNSAAGYIFQPFVSGQARSLSVLCCDGRAQLLAVNRQHVSQHQGHMEFQGVSINDQADTEGDYAVLANRIAAAIPDLWGHVGIDFIATRTGPVVVEVNPRLTVSYVGLSAALACNLAQRLLDLPTFSALHAGQALHQEAVNVH